MTSPTILPPVEDLRAPHLGLPLPAPNANAMRTDAARIAAPLSSGSPFSVASTRVRLTLNGSALNRPRVRRLRVIAA